ncbi:neuropeptide FF receptor 2-like [Paramuricea clavata]|uniref:Neuropeptide FF receptor 2-like n=1 Tax=Paramuricea clavata TaxID=317549 RepID=A0A7D9HKS8_PARCT|nr:neuropeptide FF receptor 2-like [Paramuricea clavata]
MSSGNNTSLVAPSNNEFMRLLDQLQVARFSIFSFVWVLGIWGNVMVITTICTTKRLRSSSNYFIANLAVADMGALCISVPMAVIGQVTDWPFGEIGCRFLNPLKDLFLHVSFITLTAIAIDRYIHIAHPFKPHISIYKVKLIIALIWLVDYLLVPLPMGFVMKVDRHPNGYNVCMTKWPPKGRKISILVLSGFVFLSVFTTALAYLGVGVAMFRQRGRIKKRAQGQGAATQEKALRRQLEKNAKTVKLMIVIVLVFWLTVLPLTVFGLLLELKVLKLTTSEYVISLFIVLHLLFLQHCANPIILYVLCKEMRAGFAVCVQGCCGNKKYEGSPRRCSSTQMRKDSMPTKPEQQSVYLAVNGITKMYSINHDNKRGPSVQV